MNFAWICISSPNLKLETKYDLFVQKDELCEDLYSAFQNKQVLDFIENYETVCIFNYLRKDDIYFPNPDEFIAKCANLDKTIVSTHIDFYIDNFYEDNNCIDGNIVITNSNLLKKLNTEVKDYDKIEDRYLLMLKQNKKLLRPFTLKELEELHIL